MKIGENTISEIIITDSNDELIMSVTDDDVIVKDGYKVEFRTDVNELKDDNSIN